MTAHTYKRIMLKQTLKETERLKSKKLIDQLFEGKGTSVVAFPFRVIYMSVPKRDVPVSILVSVPKKKFGHAVDRNRIKRQAREAFRKNKHILWQKLENANKSIIMAFLCISEKHCTSETIDRNMCKLLNKIAEKIDTQAADSSIE